MSFKLVMSTAVIYCISVNPVAAIEVIPKQVSQSTQEIAIDPFKIIEREQRKREREERKREREERIESQRQERERQRIQRQQELEQRQREISGGIKRLFKRLLILLLEIANRVRLQLLLRSARKSRSI